MPLPFPICVGCTQGPENRRLTKPGVGMAGKPRRGAGHRSMDCAHYEACLDLAAKRDWKTFNCESCEYGGRDRGEGAVTTPKKENARLCEDCGEKPTISPKHKLCASCMAIRSSRARSAKKKPKTKGPGGSPRKKRATKSPTEAPKKEKTAQGVHKWDSPGAGSDTALTIDFGRYSPILRAVEKIAEEELRTIDLQVVYILKHYLDERQVDG